MQTAGLNVGQPEVILLLAQEEEAGQQFVGIGSLLVDVVATVATAQARHLQAEEEHALGHRLRLVGHGGHGAAAARTAHKYFSLILAVQIYQHVAAHEARLHTHGTRESGFLVACEHALHRAVHQVGRREHSHLHGHANAVIGSQRGALGLHPLAVYPGLDGIMVKVERHILVLLAHHVHVALQDDGLAVFHARGGRFADDDIACIVPAGVQTQLLPIGKQEVNHFFLPLGRAGHTGYLIETIKHTSRI